MDSKEKKRGRPSNPGKSPYDKKKSKCENTSLDDMTKKVSNNIDSAFDEHYHYLKEALPSNLDELYQLRLQLEPESSVSSLSEIDDLIKDEIKLLNGNDEYFKKIHQTFEQFVNDDMDDVVMDILNLFADKVSILLRHKKDKVNSIIRKSIGIKMFPELKEVSLPNQLPNQD